MTELKPGSYKGATLLHLITSLKWWVRCACETEFRRPTSLLEKATLVQCEDCARSRRMRERRKLSPRCVGTGKVWARRGCICAGMGANCRTPPLPCGCPDPVEATP